ncbi:MAG: precorrin-6A synthase (deacetylating) [Pseudorhodobacter sp.]
MPPQIELFLIGIGTGNPDHLTLQAIRTLNRADLILIPRKGEAKADLAELRHVILNDVLTAPARIAEFDLPERDPAIPDYKARVEAWHDAIALVWAETITAHAADTATGSTPLGVALLVWGDPSLYDSTLRIAARLSPPPRITAIPGITSLQGLTAGHRIPLNDLAGAVTITTGRNLRDHGWPPGASRIAVMLDGDCAFQTLHPDGVHIWWGAYVGMPQEHLIEGPLRDAAPRIIADRARLRTAHGWIMDIYILSRAESP